MIAVGVSLSTAVSDNSLRKHAVNAEPTLPSSHGCQNLAAEAYPRMEACTASLKYTGQTMGPPSLVTSSLKNFARSARARCGASGSLPMAQVP